MGKIIKKNFKTKLLICIAVVMLSLLFIGAGKVTHELTERQDNRRIEHKKWSEILTGMEKEIPSEYKAEWEEIVSEKPEGLMLAVSFIRK